MSNSNRNYSVLFVCLGNICRSPAAEGVLQHLVDEQDLGKQVQVDSAGTAGYHHDQLADEHMREAAASRGLDLLSRSRKLSSDDLMDFDLVIGMDRDNIRDIEKLHSSPTAKIKLLSQYLSDEDWPTDVPDPYYGGASGFETVLDMLFEACPGILHELLSE